MIFTAYTAQNSIFLTKLNGSSAHGGVVGATELKSGSPGLKCIFDRQLEGPSSASLLYLYVDN